MNNVGWAIIGAIILLDIGSVIGWCLRKALTRAQDQSVDADLLDAAKEALDALTRNHNDEVQGDWCLADGYGLDDEVRWLEDAIAKAEGQS